MLDFLSGGRIFVAFTSLALVVVLAISIERIITLYFRFRLKVPPYKKALEQALAELDINKALRIASLNEAHPVCKVSRAGLLKANASDREMMRAMESTALEVTPAINGRTIYLSMLGNLGTLLGLIGTVLGMIKAFDGLSLADSSAKQEVLAKGIAVAMESTALGLVVAIPATLLATVFAHKQEQLLNQVEEISLAISTQISQANREAKKQAGG